MSTTCELEIAFINFVFSEIYYIGIAKLKEKSVAASSGAWKFWDKYKI